MTQKVVDTITVLAVNIGAIILNTTNSLGASDLKNILSIISITLAIGYTIWKWSNDVKKKKANIKKHYDEKDRES